MKNLNTNQSFPSPSPESDEIAYKFRDEISRAIAEENNEMTLAPDYSSYSIQQYTKMLQEYLHLQEVSPADLTESILPESLLTDKLASIDDDSHLKQNYPAGYMIQIAPIGCSTQGSYHSEDEIAYGDYLRNLIRENKENGKTVSGFSSFPNFVHKLLPQELESCSFIVKQYDQPQDHIISQSDRDRIKKQYTQAFNKLKEIFRNALVNIDNRNY